MKSDNKNDKISSILPFKSSETKEIKYEGIHQQKRASVILKQPAFQVYNMKHTFISADKAFDYIGDNSRFQKRVITIFSIQWIFYSFFVMGLPLFLETPKFQCDFNGTDDWVTCEEKSVCALQNGGFDDRFRKSSVRISVADEFDLYCDRKHYISWASSLFFVGSGLSGLILSRVGDKYGRRKSLIITMLTASISVMLTPIATTVEQLLFFFFMAGFGFCGYETITLVYNSEISGKRFRNFSTNILFITWGIGQLFINQIVQYIMSWKITMVFFVGIPLCLSVIVIYQFMVESPLYLISKNREEEANQVFRFISMYNLRPPYEFHLLQEIEQFNYLVTQIRKKDKPPAERKLQSTILKKVRPSYFYICCNPEYIKKTSNLFYAWFMRYFIYYSITFSIEHMGSTIHLSYMSLAVAEIIGALVSAPLKLKLSRILSFQITLGMITLCSFVLLFVNIPTECLLDDTDSLCWQEVVTLIMAFMLKFAITFYLVNLMTYTNEVYPTIIRSQGYGFCQSFGQIFGSALAPIYMVSWQQQYEINPLSLLGVLSALGFLQSYILQEYVFSDNVQIDNENSDKDEDTLENLDSNNKPLLRRKERRPTQSKQNFSSVELNELKKFEQ